MITTPSWPKTPFKTIHWLAWVVCLQALFFSIWVTPLGDTPDESGHFAYVVDVSKGPPLPVIRDFSNGRGVIPNDLWRDWDGGTAPSERGNYLAQHPPLYYAFAAIPYRIATAVTDDKTVHAHAARLVSVVSVGLLVLVLFATFQAAGLSHSLSVQLSVWLPLLPMMTHLSSGISNDGLLILLCAMATLTLVRFLQTRAIQHAYWCAAWMAAAGATKMTAWVLIAAFLGVILFEMRARLGRWFLHAVGISTMALSTAVAWMARNWVLYGNPTYVHGLGDAVDPKFPGYTMLTYFKEQPFFEWLAHHTLGLMGFSGYCLTAENAEVLNRMCAGAKMTAMNDGLPLWILMWTLAGLGIVLFAHMKLSYLKPTSGPARAQPRSIQEWVSDMGWQRPMGMRAVALVALVAAAIFFFYFSSNGYRISEDRISRLILMVQDRLLGYGMLFTTLFTVLLLRQSTTAFGFEGALRGVQGRYLFPFYPLLLVGVGLALHRTPKGIWLSTIVTLALILMHVVAYTDFFMPFYQSVRLS
jgi:hypothetical protein